VISPSPIFFTRHPSPSTGSRPFLASLCAWRTVGSRHLSFNRGFPLWLDHDGDNETRGNTWTRHLDRDPSDNNPDLPPPKWRDESGRLAAARIRFCSRPRPEPTVNEAGAFNQSAAVLNLFYWCNWMHDRLMSGVTEPPAIFQQDNFGRGGIGGRPHASRCPG